MISTTSKWKDWSAEFGTFHIKATLNNGTSLNLTDEDFMSGSVSITDSVSGMGSFNVGNVITNSFNATLNNFTGKFNSYNLAGATISVQFGIVSTENIYDDSQTSNNRVLNKDTGDVTLFPNMSTSGYTEVEDGATYAVGTGVYIYVCCYDSNKTYIGYVSVQDHSFTASINNETVSYVRISFNTPNRGDMFINETYEEWIDRGTYTLEKPTSLGSTIKVVGYDDMDKMNKYYIGKHPVGGVETDIIFPINAETLAMYLCDECGVDYAVDMWGLDAFQVDEFEYNESTTCRQVLSWVVQIAGGYARVNNIGKLECKTFNRHFWTVGLSLNGGTINPWESIDTYNGGSFSPWSAVTNYDGGGVGGAEFTLSKIKTLNVYVDDITVTGVRAFAYNTVNEFQFDTVGNDGYILAVQDNPLVTEDNTLAVATRVNGQIGGMSFRPFDATIFGDPSFEAGDVIALMDYLGNEHISVITSLTYALNQTERIECNAETPEQASMQTANPSVDIIAGATRAAYDYITAKKIAAEVIEAGTLGVNGTITTNDLEVLNGSKLGGFNVVGSHLEATYTLPHTYTSTDLTRVQGIVQGNITPTAEDYELYDLNGDGKIKAIDYVRIRNAVQNYNGVVSCTIIIDPSTYSGIVNVHSNLGGSAKIGAGSIVSQYAVIENLTVGDDGVDDFSIAHSYDSNGWNVMKWGSGRLDMWLRKSYSVNVNQSYGSLYFGHITPMAYATIGGSSFIETPSVSVTVESANEGDIFVGVSNTGTASQLGKICCYCATTYSGTVYVNIHAVGRWK